MGHYDDAYEAEDERVRQISREALENALVKLKEAKMILSRRINDYTVGQLQSVIDRVTLEI